MRVVIAGAGFGGLMTARNLRQSGCEVVVIDPTTAHTYTPWLFEVATCALAQQRVRRVPAGSADVDRENMAGMGHVRWRKARVTGIDKTAKHVVCDDGHTVPYDVLVIALGAVAHDFGVAGVKEHAFMLKTSHDAGHVRAAVARVFEDAKTTARHVAIVGAGPTGLEVAGEIAHAAELMAARGLFPRDRVKISVVDGSSRFFGNGSVAVGEKLAQRFARLGVSFVGDAQVTNVHGHQITYEKKAEKLTRHMPADLTIWAGGVTVNPLVLSLPLQHDERGRLAVAPTFLVTGEKDIFALGDNMSLMNPHTGKPEPMTAQAAVEEAAHVAGNIERLANGRPLRAFVARRSWHTLLAIGGRWGVGEVYGVVFSGYHAYVLRRLVDLRYFVNLLTWIPGLRFWLRGRF